MPNAISRLVHHLTHSPDKIAFSMGEQHLTFGDLASKSAHYAQWLIDQGLQPGDRVAAWLDTSLEMIIALLGHYRAGLIHVPINTRYGALEVEHVLEDSGARLLILDDDTSERYTHIQRVQKRVALEHIITCAPPTDTNHHHLQGLLEHEHATDALHWPSNDEQIALFIYTSGTLSLIHI